MTSDALIVVDRDPVFANRLTRALVTPDYRVEVATDLDKAYMQMTETPFSLAIVTLDPAGFDSSDLIRVLYRECPNTQVIILCDDQNSPTLLDLYDLSTVYSHRPKPTVSLGDVGL